MFQIGQNIKTVREYSNLSQEQFAQAFGIIGRNKKPSQDRISNYELGQTPPPVELIKKIAKAVGIDIKKFTTEYVTFEDIESITFPDWIVYDKDQGTVRELNYKKSEGQIDPNNVNSTNQNHSTEGTDVNAATDKNKNQMTASDQALLKLANANELLAKSHFNFSEANKTLSENNKDLIQMLKTTAAAPEETYEAVLSMISNLQEAVLELSQGKKFGNRNEVAALLYKTGSGEPWKADVADTRKG